mgnify:CR=1 FL=1
MTIEALVAAKPLRMGASGDAVRQIQLALKARGYPLTGTGYFGNQTDAAIEDFQRKNGLPVTGDVDRVGHHVRRIGVARAEGLAQIELALGRERRSNLLLHGARRPLLARVPEQFIGRVS